MEPAPTLKRSDSRDLRKQILALSAKETRKLGISKSTVHYLRKHARDRKPFKIYSTVLGKLGWNKV